MIMVLARSFVIRCFLTLWLLCLCTPFAAGRSELLPYNPLAAPAAVVTDGPQTARFTVLTDRLLRMELASAPGVFEDRATLAFLNRALPVPSFTHGEAGGVLTLSTASLTLTYASGSWAFNASTLRVASGNQTWRPGDFSPGNLLGTIRGLDHQRATSLNCTQNKGIDDNGEANHCEWGIPSRDGWTVVNDSLNYVLGSDFWWAPASRSAACPALRAGVDAENPVPAASAPGGVAVPDAAACCAACAADATCLAGFVFEGGGAAAPNCWPLAAWSGFKVGGVGNRSLGVFSAPASAAKEDLYLFFHGHDYAGALQDFVKVSGRAAMVPRFASGVLFSRWYDYSSADAFAALAEWQSRALPLDGWILDMNCKSRREPPLRTINPAPKKHNPLNPTPPKLYQNRAFEK